MRSISSAAPLTYSSPAPPAPSSALAAEAPPVSAPPVSAPTAAPSASAPVPGSPPPAPPAPAAVFAPEPAPAVRPMKGQVRAGFTTSAPIASVLLSPASGSAKGLLAAKTAGEDTSRAGITGDCLSYHVPQAPLYMPAALCCICTSLVAEGGIAWSMPAYCSLWHRCVFPA